MTLTERLKQIPGQVRAIRESLSAAPNRGDGGIAREAGERIIRPRGDERWNDRVLEMASLFRDVYKGVKPAWYLKEAMTTSDFPLLFGDVLYRQLLGNYVAWPSNYQEWCRVTDVNDFRTLNMYQIDGGSGIPIAAVAEREQYPETKWAESKTSLSVKKYGRRYGVSFEMMTNDDLQAFADRPQIMAQDAKMSEQYLASSKMWDSAGPDATMYSSGNGNIVTSNPALSVAGLQVAMKILSKMKDSSGRPIVVKEVFLVVGPSLEITANNILNALQILVAAGSGSATTDQLWSANWMKNRVKLIVDPMIPLIVTTGTVCDTAWALVGSPTAGRPAFHFGFLRGYRNPQLSMKDPNNLVIGGDSGGRLNGDFDTDSIDYRVRHIFGAAQGDPKLTVASKGTGS